MKLFYLLFILPSVSLTFNVSDDILHGIEWMGLLPVDFQMDTLKPLTLPILTSQKETFHCLIPSEVHRHDFVADAPPTKTVSEWDLLQPLFFKIPCSYKIEGYWMYELCHNKHVRQYHEDQMADGVNKLTEYYLGLFHSQRQSPSKTEDTSETDKPKTLDFRGKTYPYFEVNYSDGTVCDLTGQPRSISVRYICDNGGKGEMIDLVEEESCHYVAIVIVRNLCSHAAYKSVETYVNKIQCYTISESAVSPKPQSLLVFEKETNNRQHIFHPAGDMKDAAGVRVEVLKTEDSTVIFKFQPEDEEMTPTAPESPTNKNEKIPIKLNENTAQKHTETKNFPKQSKELLRSFIHGDYCIVGGSGWWKHELCFQKSVVQHHDENTGGRTVIVIGMWKKDSHLEWLKKNPQYRPSMPPESRKEIRQYYGEGDVCSLTNKKREVTVIVRCVEDTSVVITFSEPKTCEYTIVAKSSIFCPLVRQSDNDALLPDDSPLR